jgi:hypothetical protein
VVLGVTRSDGRYLGAPTGSTILHPGDNLIVYGRAGRLRELDRRMSGSAGAEARAAAIREQERIQQEDAQADTGGETSA